VVQEEPAAPAVTDVVAVAVAQQLLQTLPAQAEEAVTD
jgi:hypothetical protein